MTGYTQIRDAITITVQAFWDEEAQVWVATSDDLPGLATEAASEAELIAKLKVMVPELCELNQQPRDGHRVPTELLIHSERREALSY